MNCRYFHCANSVTVGTDVITLNFENGATASDQTRFCFKLCQTIPDTAMTFPVQLTVNGTAIPLWNKYGNPVVASDLVPYKLINGYYGATDAHVIATNIPCNCRCV